MTYDIFISYARQDAEWVKSNVFMPLSNCCKADGSRPRIFMDVSEEGIEIGQSFMAVLGDAIQNSKFYILVYSHYYFDKKITTWECEKIVQMAATGLAGRIYPILLEPSAESRIDFTINHIQYLIPTSATWFDHLISGIGLTKVNAARVTRLVFTQQPPESFTANLTLPTVQVEIHDVNGRADQKEMVSLRAEEGDLHGTLSVMAKKGMARFSDLSFGQEVESTQLIAEVSGSEPCLSSSFSITKPILPDDAEDRSQTKEACVEIDYRGEDLHFFDNSKALIIVNPDCIRTYQISGELLNEIPFAGRMRFVKKHGALLAIATWSGRILVLRDNGKAQQYMCELDVDAFNVPGDVAFFRGNIYAGFWSGMLYRLTSSGDFQVELAHAAGIQALVAIQDGFWICGLDGKISLIRQGELERTYQLEPTILALQTLQDDKVIAVGEEKLYHLALEQDSLLEVTYSFSCVLHSPDGTRALMMNRRIVYTHQEGPFAVSPAGRHVALGDKTGTKVYSDAVLPQLIGQNDND